MGAPPACGSELELARSRCARCTTASPALQRHPVPRSLLRLVAGELRLLTSNHPDPSWPLSSNLPHLAALHLLLAHPAVRPPSRLATLPGVDFACAFRSRPAWALLTRGAPRATRPEMVLVVFARGVCVDPARGLAEEFGAVEIDLLVEFLGDSEEEKDGWVSVSFNPTEEMRSFRAFEIRIADSGAQVVSSPPLRETVMMERSGEVLEGGFGAFVGKMRMDSREPVNLDTTALVAIASGISNGGVGRLMRAPEAETRARFRCNYEFVMNQSPILVELGKAVDGKKCIVCGTVNSELKEIVSMCGGSEEKNRATQLLKQLIIVQDSPSARMMDLPTTRKLAMKNKVVFGTGDQWCAPTLTANMGFARAVSQTGMPLLTIEHIPRALIGL